MARCINVTTHTSNFSKISDQKRFFRAEVRIFSFAVCGVLFLTFACAGKCGGTSNRESATGSGEQCHSHLPTRIILNVTTSPSTSQAVTWRMCGSVQRPRAEIASVAESPNLKSGVTTIQATMEKVKLGAGRFAVYYSAVFQNLVPNTVYAYRVGADDALSEWNQFRTAGDGDGSFAFVYFGDVQDKIASMCSRVLRAAYIKAPDARFWLFVGDLVNDGGSDAEWGEFFDALGWIPRTTPMVLLPGNHEYPDRRYVQGEAFKLVPLWRPQFTLPQNGPSDLKETAYYIDYQGVRFVLLNGSDKLREQASWLDRILAENRQRWTIAAIHQPIYPRNWRIWRRSSTDNPLRPIFDKHSVDLVLQGHLHRYARTAKIKNGVRVAEGEQGTVYVISVSGPKHYPALGSESAIVVKKGSGKQLYQVIRIKGSKLTFKSYDLQGRIWDSFEIAK